MVWSLRCVWQRANLWCTLSQVRPFVRVGVAEAVGHGAVGAVDDTCTAGVLNTRDRLLLLHGPGNVE